MCQLGHLGAFTPPEHIVGVTLPTFSCSFRLESGAQGDTSHLKATPCTENSLGPIGERLT